MDYKIIAGGVTYISENDLREALGIVDEYADLIGLVRKLKEERDELKEKCDKMKKRANAMYGVSCGYSGDKEPAFLCNVISYSWEFGSITDRDLMDRPTYRFRNNSIRVELDLTPTANYKGTLDLEDLKKYIQAYGREKKLSDFEIFCKLVDNCIDELCDKYTIVQPLHSLTTRERLDYIFKVLVDYRELADSNYNKAEGFRKEKRAVEDSLSELRAKIREIYLEMYLTGNDEPDSYIERLHLIHEEYKRVVHNFEERTADWYKVQKEYSRYRLAVNSLLDIPKDIRDDINAIERAFTFSKKEYKLLKEFRNDVCEILDIPSSMANDQEQILKEIHDFADRYYELNDFRADICEVLGIDADELFGSPQQNDKYILEQVEKLKDIRVVVTHGCDHNSTSLDRYARFRSNVCTALCLGGETDDEDILNAITKMREEGNKLARLRSNICSEFSLVPENCDGNIIGHIHMMQDCHDKLCKDYTELRKAIWEAMDRKPETLPEETARLVGEVRMLQLNDEALKRMHTELRKAIGMDYPVTNNDIINRVKSLYDANESNCDVISDLNRQVTELKSGETLLIEFRDAVAKAIGMDYPTTNQVILNNVQYIYKDRKDAYDIVTKLNDQVKELSKTKEDLWELRRNAVEDLKTRGFCFRPEENETLPEIYDKLLKRYDWAYGEYKEQYRLRQMWHVRWESEHERANGEHKRAEKALKEVETLKRHRQILENDILLSRNEQVAVDAFRNECRKLKEEKAKVISALGQDIWDDCLK